MLTLLSITYHPKVKQLAQYPHIFSLVIILTCLSVQVNPDGNSGIVPDHPVFKEAGHIMVRTSVSEAKTLFSAGEMSAVFNSDAWKKKAHMVYPRGEHASAVIDGEIYVFGGIHDHYQDPPYVEKYDPRQDTWKVISEWENPRHHMTAGESVWGDEVWLCGGKWGRDTASTNQVDVFNVKTNTWRQGPSLPEKHWGGPAVMVGHYLHVLTGAIDKNHSTAHHFVLDLENESAGWAPRAPVLQPVVHGAGVALDGKIYLIGGEYHHKHDGDIKTVQVYDRLPTPGIRTKPHYR